VAIGGSTTYTIKVEDDDKTFTQQLEWIIANDYGYRNVEVINAGVGGYTSWESLINLEFRVLNLQPDLIAVYHGVNDIHARLVCRACIAAVIRDTASNGRTLPFHSGNTVRYCASSAGNCIHDAGLMRQPETAKGQSCTVK
jgi:lysophospholipase L1-like esterase